MRWLHFLVNSQYYKHFKEILSAYVPKLYYYLCCLYVYKNIYTMPIRNRNKIRQSSFSINCIVFSGESSTSNPNQYACAFPQLIRLWRDIWHKNSGRGTSRSFSFWDCSGNFELVAFMGSYTYWPETNELTVTLNSILKTHNDSLDEGAHFLMMNRQILTKATWWPVCQ